MDQLIAWASGRFMESESYEDWLADLSSSKSIEAGLDVVREEMISSGIQLPDDIGDLMAGFVLMRLEKGEISEEEARVALIDVTDGYGMTGQDAESAGGVALDEPDLLEMKADAERSLKWLSTRDFKKGAPA
ncbi:hypothetical protein [Luteolibacter soli]|uniref:Uncharacterized protein n=1 Tax=Luteolibacter soli TaxID=3135280 RepID=A0ABU9B1N1_9BACT